MGRPAKDDRSATWRHAVRTCLGAALGLVVVSTMEIPAAWAQREPVHYFQSTDLPPGAIGQGQLQRGGALPGYFQPVEIQAPPGASVSLAVNGLFEPPEKAPVLAGLLIGQIYPLKITGIPLHEGFEVFPTIEVVNRLYPPPGLERHFPVPVHITAEELEFALSGRFVTRVIYLEDPNNPLPIRDTPGFQRYFDVAAEEDPLKVADRLGRPVAILRMGSRTPDVNGATGQLAIVSPPLQKLTRPGPVPALKSGLEPPLEPPPGGSGRNPPRLPLRGEVFPGAAPGLR